MLYQKIGAEESLVAFQKEINEKLKRRKEDQMHSRKKVKLPKIKRNPGHILKKEFKENTVNIMDEDERKREEIIEQKYQDKMKRVK